MHSYWYIPSAPRENYSLLVMESTGMIKMATEEGFPLRQGAGTCLDWFSVATEAYGGGTPDLFCSSKFLGYMGIYRRKKYVGGSPGGPRGRGARLGGVGVPPTLVSSPRLSWSISDTPWASSGPKITSVKFQVNWTPFDFPFLRYSKTRKKQKLTLGSGLIG